VHCDEYSTEGGGSVMVPRSRSALLSVCEARSEKLNWLRRLVASSSPAPSPSAFFFSASFAAAAFSSSSRSFCFFASSDAWWNKQPSCVKWFASWSTDGSILNFFVAWSQRTMLTGAPGLSAFRIFVVSSLSSLSVSIS
jgi:hypothetical protein